MDVLQVLKEGHREIRALLNEVSGAKSKAQFIKKFNELQKQLTCHLTLQENYLYPEVLETIGSGQGFAEFLKRHFAIFSQLQAMAKLVKRTSSELNDLRSKFDKLQATVIQHFIEEEDLLLPRLRKMIPTADREELGQLCLEAKTEAELDRSFAPNLVKIMENITAPL